jgi:hypothetical protein
MTSLAAVVASALFMAMVVFQAALALGAPLGADVLGGRHPGRLPVLLRVFSGIVAVVLVGAAVVILARAGLIGWPSGGASLLAPASWAIAGFLVLNTLGNLISRSRVERTIFAAITALLALLCAYVALAGGNSTNQL